MDDILNGNVTESGKYFTGIKTLSTSLTTVKNNLTNIDAQFSTIIPTGATALATTNAYNAARTAIDIIPTNAAAGKVSAYNYKTAFNNAAGTLTLPSTLPNALGSTNAADSTSAVYLTYTGLATIQSVIDQITVGAQAIKTQISGGFGTALDSAKGVMKNISNTLEGGDTKFYETYSSISPNFPLINTAVTGIYAGFVAIASVGLLATLLLLICNLYKCRYLLYFTCLIMVIIGFITFFLSILLSAFLPFIYFTCDFATFSFSSKANFDSNYLYI